jgi:arsenate reductase
MTAPIRVLFLCTHNSARSQIAEALLRHFGGEQFAAFSAGTEVTRVHPLALAVLAERGIPTDGLFSKHVQDFAGQRFDVVITVCDRARDACPVFPSGTEQMHWSFPDPSAAEGTEEERLNAFRAVRQGLTERLGPFIAAQRRKRDRAAIVTT